MAIFARPFIVMRCGAYLLDCIGVHAAVRFLPDSSLPCILIDRSSASLDNTAAHYCFPAQNWDSAMGEVIIQRGLFPCLCKEYPKEHDIQLNYIRLDLGMMFLSFFFPRRNGSNIIFYTATT